MRRGHGTLALMAEPELLSEGLGLAMRVRRARLGFSQRDAAQRAGLSVKHWGAIERGEKHPGVETAAQVARALDTSLPDLLREAIDLGPEAAELSARRRQGTDEQAA